ncbi:MAG: imidazolonepropionase [Alphaproteobacteria bacterium]
MTALDADRLFVGARLATMIAGDTTYGAIEAGALAVGQGRILWAGPMAEMPEINAARVDDLEGRWITPGLIDCHTHIVYGGNRAEEFEKRLQGVSYEQIAKAGGGIISTVNATRSANEEELYKSAEIRLSAMIDEGVTTIEIKSGYGLTTDSEIKMLSVARLLGESCPVTVTTSFLGAHAIPPEYKDDADGYTDLVAGDMLDAVMAEGLADAVDGFCEGIAFSTDQMRRVFKAAAAYGIPVKLHAEQLSNLGGAALAAEFMALSADHLEYLDQAGVDAMAKAGTVAVILPGAFYTLHETQKPPIEALRKAGVPMALATDCNPGSSPVTSPLLTMNMGCTLFAMTPEETLAGFTRDAARALGLGAVMGTLEMGKKADLAIWDINHPAELSYNIGLNPLYRRYWHGDSLPG